MGLRDKNPYIDSDLALIITTFEKSMANSSQEAALLVPFRREINAFNGVPRTVIESVSSVPAFERAAEGGGRSQGSLPTIPTREGALADDDEAEAEVVLISEDADDQEEWAEKAKEWLAECVPCDFRRWTKEDPSFFQNLKADWENALDKIDGALDNFENNLLNSDVVFSNLCEIASQIKFHCLPDLKKIIWLLNFLLGKLNKEFDINLNIFDNLIMGILTPIVNAMLSNLDMIDDLALAPIRCVIDQLNLTIRNFQNANLQATVRPPTVLVRAAERREEERLSAEARRRQVIDNARAQQATQKVSSFLQQVKVRTDLDILSRYLQVGVNYATNYKDWFLNLLQEIVGTEVDSWNQKIGLSGQKLDLLRLVALVRAVVEASENGEFACGPEEEGLTQDDLRTLVDSYLNPNASLEISLEDGNLVIRRDRRQEELDASDAEASSRNARTGQVDDPTRPSRKIPSNIVLTKPLSSCLKKVTSEEFSQVQQWIRQLEEDIE